MTLTWIDTHLLCELHLDVVDLVHDDVLEPQHALALDQLVAVLVQEPALLLPVGALRGGHAGLALLEEGAWNREKLLIYVDYITLQITSTIFVTIFIGTE